MIDQVVLAVPARPGELLERSLRNLRHLGVDVGWVPAPPEPRAGARHRPGRRRAAGPAARAPARRLALAAQGGSRTAPGRRILLLVLAPLMLLIALAVRLDTPGPVLYRQRRHGFSQQPIACSSSAPCMPSCATRSTPATSARPPGRPARHPRRPLPAPHQPRRAAAAAQCAAGDMSLVGPRPHAVAHDQLLRRRRSTTISAATASSPASPAGPRSTAIAARPGPSSDMRRRIELDLEYIDAGPCGSTCGSWRARFWSASATPMPTSG